MSAVQTETAAKDPVYVVLLNYNGWSHTIECLESVLRSDYDNTRVIVVDNGSTDGSVERFVGWASGAHSYERPPSPLAHLSWPPVPKPIEHVVLSRRGADHAPLREVSAPLTIIANAANQGFAAGNNIALRWLLSMRRDGYVCLVNNDMVVAPNALRALVDAHRADPQIGATGGVVLEYHQPDVVQMVGGARASALGATRVFGAGLRAENVPTTYALDFVGGGCLLMRLQTLRDVGLLDERFFLYAEDIDWGVRLRQRQYRLTYATGAHVWHKGGQATGPGSPFQDYHLVRAMLQYVRKHSPHLSLAALGYSMYRSLAPKIVRGQWARMRAVVRAYVDLARD